MFVMRERDMIFSFGRHAYPWSDARICGRFGERSLTRYIDAAAHFRPKAKLPLMQYFCTMPVWKISS
jgi:hypothetical protein